MVPIRQEKERRKEGRRKGERRRQRGRQERRDGRKDGRGKRKEGCSGETQLSQCCGRLGLSWGASCVQPGGGGQCPQQYHTVTATPHVFRLPPVVSSVHIKHTSTHKNRGPEGHGPVDSSLLTWLNPMATVNISGGTDGLHILQAIFHSLSLSQLGF